MQGTGTENRIRLCGAEEMDPEKTFGCGQCFRWDPDGSGGFIGVARGLPARVWTENGGVYIASDGETFERVWRDYFDLDTDYEDLREGFGAPEYLKTCAGFGRGIRLLRQEPWEALASFILSQCNNIPRIRAIVARLCRLFGEPVFFEGRTLYAFPSAERVAGLSEGDLAPLRCGYRAGYLLEAARAAASGALDLEALRGVSYEEKMAALLSLRGVGVKVANCAALYGLHDLSGFPVDVWMKRALKAHFPPDFDPRSLGPRAGLAQQYIFYYARSSGG